MMHQILYMPSVRLDMVIGFRIDFGRAFVINLTIQ